MIKEIVDFFDHLEDKIRRFLSARPILYAAIGSIGIVLLWRGIWHTADDFFITGPISALAGAIILLLTGIFVSGFIGNRILLTGIKNEKKLSEKSQSEIEKEITNEKKVLTEVQKTISRIEKKIDHLEEK